MASIERAFGKVKKTKRRIKSEREETFSTESKCGTEETHETIDWNRSSRWNSCTKTAEIENDGI